jgi:hypothetical protein
MKQLSRSHRKYGFQIHAFVFVLTMVLLAAINLAKGPPYWVLWTLLGWGIGLASHWWFALGPGADRAGQS